MIPDSSRKTKAEIHQILKKCKYNKKRASFNSRKKNLPAIVDQVQIDTNMENTLIHIAGTNGKGSTTQLLQTLLINTGFTCITLTSPHLFNVNERIQINGEPITDEMLLRAFQAIGEQQINKLTFHDAFFACALYWFQYNSPDFFIIEAGIGGKEDSSNIFDSHLLSIITPISLDHTHLLGNTIKEIAWDKAHIMRPERPCISVAQTNEAADSLRAYANKINASLSILGEDIPFKSHESNFLLANTKYPNPALPGAHQQCNAAVAITAYQTIAKIKAFKPINIKKSLQQTKLAGRLELIQNKPINQNIQHTIYIDVAHNEAGFQVLDEFLTNIKSPIYGWFASPLNKELGKSFDLLLSKFNKIIIQLIQDEHFKSKKDYHIEHNNIYFSNDFKNSLELLRKQPQGTLIIFGSFRWIDQLMQT